MKQFFKGILLGTLLVVFVLFVFFLMSSCKQKGQKCIQVLDGDTFVLENGQHIRMAEIDCPEITQEYGEQAKMYTHWLIYGKELSIKIVDTDRYNRLVAEVYVGSLWVNEDIVKNGYAWVYKPFGSDELLKEMYYARKERIGLWHGKNIIPPFKFRANEHK